MEIYITHAKRTAVGSFLGSLSNVPAHILGGQLIKNILQESKIAPELIDETILGPVLTGGSGQNPARQRAVRKAGIHSPRLRHRDDYANRLLGCLAARWSQLHPDHAPILPVPRTSDQVPVLEPVEQAADAVCLLKQQRRQHGRRQSLLGEVDQCQDSLLGDAKLEVAEPFLQASLSHVAGVNQRH